MAISISKAAKRKSSSRGGSNISPQEVEAVLYQHPAVREAGVAGVPDGVWGERVIAFVSRRPGQGVTAEEVIGFVAKRLAAYKTPEEIVFLDSFPKNAAGKIQRRALRELYLAAAPNPGARNSLRAFSKSPWAE